MPKLPINEIKYKASDIREDIINMLLKAGSGHSAGPLGLADIFACLYFGVMNHDPQNPKMLSREGWFCPAAT
jgi:transketolase